MAPVTYTLYRTRSSEVVNTICFGQLASHLRSSDIQGAGYGCTHGPLTTPEEQELFSFIQTVWDFPKLMKGWTVEDWNKGKLVQMDKEKYSPWDVFNHFALLRYLNHRNGDVPEFPAEFAKFTKMTSASPAQVFILTNLFGRPGWIMNHMFFTGYVDYGSIEHIWSMDDLKVSWPVGDVSEAATRVVYGLGIPWTETIVNAFRRTTTEPTVDYLTLNEATKRVLFPTTYKKVFKDME